MVDGTCKLIPVIPAPALTELAAAPVPGTADAMAAWLVSNGPIVVF